MIAYRGAHRRWRAWWRRAAGALLDWAADAAPDHTWTCGACPASITSSDEHTVLRYAAAHLDRTGHYYTNAPSERQTDE